MDITGAIIAFEDGELDDESTIALFQELVDSGIAWSLQGSYGRLAASLIEAGLVVPAGAGASDQHGFEVDNDPDGEHGFAV